MAGAVPAAGIAYPLLDETTMAEEEAQEAIEVCTSLLDKFSDDLERCTHRIRDGLSKRLGAGPWHVVLGASFAYSVGHEVRFDRAEGAGGTALAASESSPAVTTLPLQKNPEMICIARCNRILVSTPVTDKEHDFLPPERAHWRACLEGLSLLDSVRRCGAVPPAILPRHRAHSSWTRLWAFGSTSTAAKASLVALRWHGGEGRRLMSGRATEATALHSPDSPIPLILRA